jgi:hypothetical protein
VRYGYGYIGRENGTLGLATLFAMAVDKLSKRAGDFVTDAGAQAATHCFHFSHMRCFASISSSFRLKQKYYSKNAFSCCTMGLEKTIPESWD